MAFATAFEPRRNRTTELLLLPPQRLLLALPTLLVLLCVALPPMAAATPVLVDSGDAAAAVAARAAAAVAARAAAAVAAPTSLGAACNITVTGHPPARADSMGAYALQAGNATGGRPAYLGASNGQWLWYNTGYGAWCIGATLGRGDAYLFAQDHAQTPDKVVATWIVVDGGSGQLAPSVKASCAPPTPNMTDR